MVSVSLDSWWFAAEFQYKHLLDARENPSNLNEYDILILNTIKTAPFLLKNPLNNELSINKQIKTKANVDYLMVCRSYILF